VAAAKHFPKVYLGILRYSLESRYGYDLGIGQHDLELVHDYEITMSVRFFNCVPILLMNSYTHKCAVASSIPIFVSFKCNASFSAFNSSFLKSAHPIFCQLLEIPSVEDDPVSFWR